MANSFMDQAINLIASDTPLDVQRGTAYLILELVQELKKQNSTTLHSKRKPEEGDTTVMNCYRCKENTLHALKKSVFKPHGLEWLCMKCKRIN
jgi:hypothetical protein